MNTIHPWILAISLIGMAACSTSAIKQDKDLAPEKNNIVLIMVDDLGYSDVAYMHNKQGINTPNIDKLAQSGMVFTDAYAAAPVCSPTRASLMTGKYPATLKLTCHIPGMGMEKYLEKLSEGHSLKEAYFRDHLPMDEFTIAEALKEQGYSTGYIGKWHLGGAGSIYTEDGTINTAYHPDNQGFDINIGGNAYGQPKSYFDPYFNGTIQDRKEGEYLTDRLGDEAVQFIEQNQNQPFFLNLATYTVHTPLDAPEEIVEKYEGNKYFAMIEKLDQNVGKVMDKLEALNLLENTLVVFYSDNGGLWGNAPLKGIKGTLNEGGIRVPMIVSFHGKIKAGSQSATPVTTVDFFPTFLELAGGNPSLYPEVEGKSLLPLVYGKADFPERPIYWHFPHHRKEGLSMGAAIREGDWKLITSFETEEVFLYNLKDDLGEVNNLSDSFPDKKLALLAKLEAWQEEIDAEMPLKNDNE
ncbi:sulfatase [Echinicola pacifica]|uniref:Sulfatase n=1 Tax=Echinicola pacifica TaxID=346377 RepID=A0A918PNH9_9BACT|nr:sulfatase [Echinicola pacifica]GGZ16878.1 sulfatase [Echinicola pacifica]